MNTPMQEAMRPFSDLSGGEQEPPPDDDEVQGMANFLHEALNQDSELKIQRAHIMIDRLIADLRNALAATQGRQEPQGGMSELPPLPDPISLGTYYPRGIPEALLAFTADQMRDYARRAILSAGEKK